MNTTRFSVAAVLFSELEVMIEYLPLFYSSFLHIVSLSSGFTLKCSRRTYQLSSRAARDMHRSVNLIQFRPSIGDRSKQNLQQLMGFRGHYCCHSNAVEHSAAVQSRLISGSYVILHRYELRVQPPPQPPASVQVYVLPVQTHN